jgi:dTDP-4-dehydrorhamnose reductase
MKILVLGANGMAGHLIKAYLKNQGHEVHGASRHPGDVQLDVESESSRNNFFFSTLAANADFVINCIGVLGPDSNKNPARTVLLNSWWPHYLETRYAHNKAKVIHISTDCIFDGSRGWYIESDLPTETNLYGRSKALGEINNEKDITFRMSIIGTEIKKEGRSGLLNWVINNEEDKIYGWEKSIWNGITTYELAKQIAHYINNPSISGIYHLVPDYTISKYHLVSHINDVFNCGKEVIPVAGKEENKTLLDTRNEYKIFTTIPDYREQLLELKDFSEKI